MLAKLFLNTNGEQVLNGLLEIIKNLLKPIIVFLVAISKILYPVLIVIGIILYALDQRWIAWRFLSSGILTAIMVELVIPSLGLV